MKFSLWTFFIIPFLILLIVQCNFTPKSFRVSVDDAIALENIPSGSGMAFLNDTIYIISDDSPYLFQMNREFRMMQKIKITKGFKDIHRIEKQKKPDYECLASFQTSEKTSLYGFGSGSLTGKRDSLIVIDLDDTVDFELYNITSFYDQLDSLTGGRNREKLNIEGAAINDENLYLLNRGTNSVFIVKIEAFNNYLDEEANLSGLQIEHFKVALPRKENEYIGLSGCTIIPGTSTILFTATVEATTDWIADGEILGSYIGLIPLNELHKQEPPLLWQFESNGQALMDKIESITITKPEGNNTYAALAIADNDDGTSKIYPLKISLK